QSRCRLLPRGAARVPLCGNRLGRAAPVDRGAQCQPPATTLPLRRRILLVVTGVLREGRGPSREFNLHRGEHVKVWTPRFVSIVLVAAAALATPALAQPRPITLQETLAMARRNALVAIQARAQSKTTAAA